MSHDEPPGPNESEETPGPFRTGVRYEDEARHAEPGDIDTPLPMIGDREARLLIQGMLENLPVVVTALDAEGRV